MSSGLFCAPSLVLSNLPYSSFTCKQLDNPFLHYTNVKHYNTSNVGLHCPHVDLHLGSSQPPQALLTLAANKLTELKKKDMDDKFIICLNKVAKHFPPFMDR